MEQKLIDELSVLVPELKSNMNWFEQVRLEMKAAQDRIDELEAKANTPGITAPVATDMEAKAFGRLMTKGHASPDEMKLISMDTDSSGGYFMPVTTSSKIIDTIMNISPVRQFATVEQVSGDVLEVPKMVGAFASGWLAERGTPAVGTNATFGMDKIPTHAQYAMPYATQKSLDMSTFNFESFIAGGVARKFAQDEGTAFISGTGVGQPEGILTNGSIDSVKSGDAAKLTADGIKSLIYSLPEQYIMGARFMMRRATEGLISMLKDGNGNYLWQKSFADGVPATLCGFPISYAEDMPAVAGGAFPILFGHFGESYRIADNPKMTVIRDIYTQKGFVLFYTSRSTGGQVVNPAAMKKLVISA